MHLHIEGYGCDHDAGNAAQGKQNEESQSEQEGRFINGFSGGDGGNPGYYLDAARYGNDGTGSREEGQRHVWQAGGEHMVNPQSKRYKAGRYNRHGNQCMPGNTLARKDRDNHRHDPGSRYELQVDFRMPKDPKQVLPEQRAAPGKMVVDVGAKFAVKLEHVRANNQWSKGKQQRDGCDEHGPAVDGHLAD